MTIFNWSLQIYLTYFQNTKRIREILLQLLFLVAQKHIGDLHYFDVQAGKTKF